jgi:hypothetical protein
MQRRVSKSRDLKLSDSKAADYFELALNDRSEFVLKGLDFNPTLVSQDQPRVYTLPKNPKFVTNGKFGGVLAPEGRALNTCWSFSVNFLAAKGMFLKPPQFSTHRQTLISQRQ